MTVPTRPADVGRLARAVTAAGLGGLGLLVAAPAAHAVTVPPGVYVVDEAGVLSTSDEQRLTQEIQDLRRDTGQGLYVVYVDEFSTDAQTLAQDVARQRGLGTNDSVLAIAVEDRAYGLDSGGDADLQNQVTRTYVGPELSKIGTDPGSAEWLAAGTAAVQGLDDAADGTLDGTGASGAEYDPAGALPAGTAGDGSTAQGASGGGALTAVLGAGAVGAHAMRAAVRYGDDALRAELRAKKVPGVEVTSIDLELTTSPAYLMKRLALTDLLVDATQRRDTTQVIIRNEWLAHLPAHAVVVDLSVDPYDFTRDPPGVKGVEGIPQGSLDQYVFAPEDPAWDAIDARVPHNVRRSVVSCYSWPGIDPAACMRVYGKQIEPVLRALIEKGPERLKALGGPWMERATARAMHRHFLPPTETTQ